MAWRVYLLVVLAYALLFTFWRQEPVPLHAHVAAVLLAATCFVPMALWYSRGRQGLPMFELICVSYALQFSMPVYTERNWITIMSQTMPLPWDGLVGALLAVEAGMIALFLGYYVVWQSRVAQELPKLDLPMDPSRRWLYLVGAIIFGGLIALLQALNWEPLTSSALGAIVRLAASQLNIAIILLGYEVYGRPTRSLALTLLLYLAVALAFLVGLVTGLLENAFIPLVLLLMVRWQALRRFPWVGLIAGMILFFFLNPAKFEYRSQVWYGNSDAGLVQRLDLWTDLVGERTTDLTSANWTASNEENLRETLSRFDLLHKFIWVRELTPTAVPYYRGATYSYFLYTYIPRALWPGKPLASAAGDRMDIDYRLKLEWQTSSIGIGLLPEAYVNFGIAGVIVIMALQGLVFALVGRILNGPRSEGGRAIYLAVMVYFLNGIGSAAAVAFGALAQQIVASALILRPFARGFQAHEQGSPHVPPGARPARTHPTAHARPPKFGGESEMEERPR